MKPSFKIIRIITATIGFASFFAACGVKTKNEIINTFFKENEDFIFMNFYFSGGYNLGTEGSYKLYRNGKCDYYIYNRFEKTRNLFGGFGDVIVERKWEIFAKDSIRIMSTEYFYTIEKDTLKIRSKYENGDYKLWKSN